MFCSMKKFGCLALLVIGVFAGGCAVNVPLLPAMMMAGQPSSVVTEPFPKLDAEAAPVLASGK